MAAPTSKVIWYCTIKTHLTKTSRTWCSRVSHLIHHWIPTPIPLTVRDQQWVQTFLLIRQAAKAYTSSHSRGRLCSLVEYKTVNSKSHSMVAKRVHCYRKRWRNFVYASQTTISHPFLKQFVLRSGAWCYSSSMRKFLWRSLVCHPSCLLILTAIRACCHFSSAHSASTSFLTTMSRERTYIRDKRSTSPASSTI